MIQSIEHKARGTLLASSPIPLLHCVFSGWIDRNLFWLADHLAKPSGNASNNSVTADTLPASNTAYGHLPVAKGASQLFRKQCRTHFGGYAHLQAMVDKTAAQTIKKHHIPTSVAVNIS